MNTQQWPQSTRVHCLNVGRGASISACGVSTSNPDLDLPQVAESSAILDVMARRNPGYGSSRGNESYGFPGTPYSVPSPCLDPAISVRRQGAGAARCISSRCALYLSCINWLSNSRYSCSMRSISARSKYFMIW